MYCWSCSRLLKLDGFYVAVAAHESQVSDTSARACFKIALLVPKQGASS